MLLSLLLALTFLLQVWMYICFLNFLVVIFLIPFPSPFLLSYFILIYCPCLFILLVYCYDLILYTISIFVCFSITAVCLPVCLSTYLSIYFFIHLSPVCLSMYLSISLSIYHLSVCLSVYLPIRILSFPTPLPSNPWVTPPPPMTFLHVTRPSTCPPVTPWSPTLRDYRPYVISRPEGVDHTPTCH